LSILKIQTAKIFEPLLAPARYKGIYGGRGSGKSHFFGELLVEICQAERGTLAVCIREAQRALAQSSKRLIESKIAALGLGRQFRIYSDKIETPGDGLIIFRACKRTPRITSPQRIISFALATVCMNRRIHGHGPTHCIGKSPSNDGVIAVDGNF
jgi:phage terminase large subunit